jgi:2-polyprenyl-3-methyl-5-hydroxy-6-metoxy-1,4-benzoquinol methylase
LDIGCGTGNLTLELSKLFTEVVGIDLDAAMVNRAKKHISSSSGNLRFLNSNMLDIDTDFGENSFDAIVCFGNTLVHLNSEQNILDFFTKSRKVLREEGKLLLQIINYDRIIEQEINGLSTIENEVIKFERNYIHHKERNVIDFETLLTIKEGNHRINNKIELYPVRKSHVEELLLKAGFSDISFYGSFKRDKLTPESIPLVVEASN